MAEAGGEGKGPDAPDGDGAGVRPVELATAPGIAEGEPVGSAVAGPSEALLVDEGLEEDGAIAVAGVPIRGEPACSKAQKVGGRGASTAPRGG